MHSANSCLDLARLWKVLGQSLSTSHRTANGRHYERGGLTVQYIECKVRKRRDMTATATYSRKSASRTLLALSFALVASRYGWRQRQLGTVFGIITDSTGAVVVEAEVTLVNISTGLKRNAHTDARG